MTADEYILLHTYDWRREDTSGYHAGDEYIRVPSGQGTTTYECLEVRRRVHTTGDEYIQVHFSTQKQETSTKSTITVKLKKPVHKNSNFNLEAEILSYVVSKHYMFLQTRPSPV